MKRKIKWSTIILLIGCFVGLSLLLYPSFADYWNSNHATHAITEYVDKMRDIDDDRYKEMWEEAKQYNQDLLGRANPYFIDAETEERYNKCLDFIGNGLMGYVDIEKINVSLPLYHGTADAILNAATGHLNWTSLPTGGRSTHCAISGHRGLINARLFTDLDQLREGDRFTLNILDETLTYEVDQIRVVLPNELRDLEIIKGGDYCTLVTCTPYGINTHRLLVRGHRVENAAGIVHVVSEAVVIEPLVVAPVLAFPLLFILLMMVLLKKPEKKPDLNTMMHRT